YTMAQAEWIVDEAAALYQGAKRQIMA
ncbi:hypothetical protein A2U01_0115649, partial [Trifolium medium]|nr:hypothetical protein [Trifolium medium]